MAPVLKKPDDVVIERRSGLDASSNTILHAYVVTCPGLNADGGQYLTMNEAEDAARRIAEDHDWSVWYEEHPASGSGVLIASFRKTS